MAYVVRDEGEGIDRLIYRFRRQLEAGGVLREARRRVAFIPAHERRRERIRAAERRRRRAQRHQGGKNA